MQVILVTNRKGGVGKTTISLNLAIGLSNMGKRTLLLDGDVDQADATYWALGSSDFESGVVYQTNYGFDVCWAAREEDIPNASGYEYVVIDGRPSAMVSLRYVKDADCILIPYTDERGYQQGIDFGKPVHRLNKGAEVLMVANGVKPIGEGDYLLPFDRFIRRKGWNSAQPVYKEKLNLLYRG